MGFPPLDFESSASTNFTTPASFAFKKMVELRRIELLTSCMPCKRSPS